LNAIKFSYKYLKLPQSRRALLLQSFVIEFKDLSPKFKAYDTEYWEGGNGEARRESKFYPLPETKCIVLLFQAEKVFTTIRKWTPEKEKLYKSQEGMMFALEVEGE
jgi:hypothetical protein